jgi:hypothetical protein
MAARRRVPVNCGLKSLAVCEYIDFNATGKNFYLFDTFCGVKYILLSASRPSARSRSDLDVGIRGAASGSADRVTILHAALVGADESWIG